MSRSIAFDGIRADVLAIVGAVPSGKVTTFGDIGGYMTVMPRHVAYILGRLTPDEQDRVAWYRVVGASGKLGKKKVDAMGRSQAELLQAESVVVRNGIVTDFERVFVPVVDLDCGVEPGKNYSK
ncbi:MAG: MGMT family protein [Acidobacteriota bacterium]